MSAGSGEFDLGTAGRGGEFLPFSDAAEAEEFLRVHIGPDEVRAAVAEDGAGPEMKHLDDPQILQAAAQRIARGEIHVYPRAAAAAPAFAGEEEAKAPKAAQKGEKSWIAFRFVHDITGEPIANLQLKVTLSDGEVREVNTNEDGRIEFEEIPEGTCTVMSPSGRMSRENSCAFVGTGAKDADAVGRKPTRTSDRSLFIIDAEDHRLGAGETLVDVAKAHGLSGEELSRFNWGTADPDEEEPAFALPQKDEPPLVVIPKAWSRDRWETDRTHIIRVIPLFEFRVRVHLEKEEIADERFRLFSSDGSYEQVRTLRDDGVGEETFRDLFFVLRPDLDYSLEAVSPEEEKPYLVFKDIPYRKLLGGGARLSARPAALRDYATLGELEEDVSQNEHLEA